MLPASFSLPEGVLPWLWATRIGGCFSALLLWVFLFWALHTGEATDQVFVFLFPAFYLLLVLGTLLQKTLRKVLLWAVPFNLAGLGVATAELLEMAGRSSVDLTFWTLFALAQMTGTVAASVGWWKLRPDVTASPLAAPAGRAMWAARGAALLSLLAVAALASAGPPNLMILGVIYLTVFIGLFSRKNRREALAWALASGVAGSLLGLAALPCSAQALRYGGHWIIPVARTTAPFTQAALVLSAIWAFRAIGKETGDRRILLQAFAVLGIFFVLINLSPAVSGCTASRLAVNEASAVASLRTLTTAQITYDSTYRSGFTDVLTKLCSPSGGQPGVNNADLLDPVLCNQRGAGTTFTKNGYIFTYAPGPRGSSGHIASYTITARPAEFQKNGVRSFITDQTAVIHATWENRAASAQDPPI